MKGRGRAVLTCVLAATVALAGLGCGSIKDGWEDKAGPPRAGLLSANCLLCQKRWRRPHWRHLPVYRHRPARLSVQHPRLGAQLELRRFVLRQRTRPGRPFHRQDDGQQQQRPTALRQAGRQARWPTCARRRRRRSTATPRRATTTITASTTRTSGSAFRRLSTWSSKSAPASRTLTKYGRC